MLNIVADEMNIGDLKEGLWALALARTDGDETKAKGVYLLSRVASLKDSIEIERQAEIQRDIKAIELKEKDEKEKKSDFWSEETKKELDAHNQVITQQTNF